MRSPRHSPRPQPRPTASRRKRAGQRGVALLMVLAAVALLYVMAEQQRDEVEVYSLSAAVERDQLIAEYQARSAINLTQVLLYAEPTIRRAIAPILTPLMAIMGLGLAMPPQIPVWEQADLLLGAFRNREGSAAFGQLAGVDLGSAKGLGALTGLEPIVIVDEDAKININGVVRSTVAQTLVGKQLQGLLLNQSLNPFFELRDPDGQFTDRPTIISNVIDYLDFDVNAFDATSLLAANASAAASGSEDDTFYSTLRPPYRRRNAPLDSIEELRMVRGFGDDDLWAAVVDPDPGSPRRRTLTVWGQGAVNVNTANAQTVLALICAYAPDAPQCNDPTQMSMFITSITMVQSLTLSMGVPLFQSPAGFVQTVRGQGPMGQMLTTMLHMQPFVVRDPSALARSATVESKVFSVYAEATINSAHVRIHAVIDMRPQPPLPSTYMRAANMTLVPTNTPPLPGPNGAPATGTNPAGTPPPGGVGIVSSRGGTIIYWRED